MSPSIGVGGKEIETSSTISDAASLVARITSGRKRGRPQKNQKLDIGKSIGPASLVISPKEISDVIPGTLVTEKTTVVELSNLLPSLQGKGSEMTDKTNDILSTENIIR